MNLPDLSDYHLGVDLDHTTFNPLPAICAAANDKYDLCWEPTDITAYKQPIPGTDDTIATVIYELHTDPSFIQEMEPMPGAIDALKALSDAGATINIVTHREPSTFEWTRHSLDEQGVPYDHFVEDVPENKADIDHPIDILIDDLHPMVEGMADIGKDGILFLRPYNLEDIPTHENVHTPLRNGHTPEELLTNPEYQWNEICNIIADIASR